MNRAITTRPLHGGTLPHLADFNETIVLEAIRRSEAGCSRVELTRITGLSGQTITNIARRLLERDLIREGGKATPVGVGKPRTILHLNPAGVYAVGVHIDPSSITYVLLDFTGTAVADVTHRTPSVTDPQPVLDEITTNVESLVANSGVDRERVIGVGIASPGPVDVAAGVVLNPPLLPGWIDVPLRDHLQDRTGLPTILDKDVIAGVVAEQWVADAGQSRNFAFIYVGTGIGAGLVVNGQVLRGTSSNMGDIGLMPVSTTGDPDADARDFSALGAVASAHVVMRQAARRGILPADFGEVQPAEAASAFHVLRVLADGGSESARGMLIDMAKYLASGIVTITNLLDLDSVLLGGPIWQELEPYAIDILREEVNRRTVSRPVHEITVGGTSLGDKVTAIGAGCLVLDQRFAPRFVPSKVRG